MPKIFNKFSKVGRFWFTEILNAHETVKATQSKGLSSTADYQKVSEKFGMSLKQIPSYHFFINFDSLSTKKKYRKTPFFGFLNTDF